MSKLGLGKGLSSLLGSDEGAVFGEDTKELSSIKIDDIVANPHQPRTDFNEDSLAELAQSIKTNGVISPIIVRKKGEKFEIIAGERRYRASKIAKIDEIPARIIQATDKQVAEMALIENLQREDLNPLEEALGYKELIKKHNMTQDDIAKSVGKSRSAIANSTRILALDEQILKMIREAQLSVGHARAVLSVENKNQHIEFANKIIEQELSVRQAEKEAKILNTGENLGDPDELACIEDFENRVQDSLCRKVKVVQNKNRKKGKVVLEYFNNEDLENLIEVLSSMKM